MIRCSALNDAANCGLSATIEDGSTNAAALMGNAFHAAVAARFRPTEERFQEARAIAMGQLGGEHEAEVREMVDRLAAEWSPPKGAIFEAPIGLARSGVAVAKGDPLAITEGTTDCFWDDPEEESVVVLDFKSGARAAWDVPIPRENLQLAAYGLALADDLSRSKMRLGLYLAREGKWLWDLVDLDSAAGTALWERVLAASLRDPKEAVIGPHCSDCWVRTRCPAHLLPVTSTAERVTAMAPLATGAGGIIEPRKLMRMLQACQAMEAVADAGKEWLKAYVRDHGAILVDGKQWGPIPVKGKESTSVKALKESGIYERAVAVGAVKQGATTLQHRWTKARAA